MKKLISILLVLIVLVNVVGFGFMNFRSSAEGITATILTVVALVGSGIIGAAAGEAAYGTGGALQSVAEQAHFNEIQNDLQNDNLLTASVNENNVITFSVSPSCSSDSAEFAGILCEKMNSLDPVVRTALPVTGSYKMTADAYADVKNACMNAYVDYVNHKAEVQAAAEAGTGAASTLSELGAVTIPFDFTGPVAEMTLPSLSGSVSLDAEGFHFYSPYAFSNKIYFDTTAQALAHGGSYTYEHPSGDLYRPYYQFSSYGWGYYIVYNGDLFYRECQSSDTIKFYEDVVPYTGTLNDYWGCKNSQGVRFSDVFSGDYDVNHYYGGVYYMTEAKDSDHLIPGGSYTTDDFIASSAVADVIQSIRNHTEEIVGAAEELGVISGNPELTIGQDGSIEAVDGISLELLEQLVGQLSDGTFKEFDSIEEYLLAIEGILTQQKLKVDAIESVIGNIRDHTSDIAEINEAIQSISESLAISQEITADYDFDIDTPSTIIDKFPFSLPFDIYNTFNLLSAQPVAPKFKFPFKMEGVFDFSIDVDLSDYNWIAEVVRWLLYVIFIIGLILATNKLIGRG